MNKAGVLLLFLLAAATAHAFDLGNLINKSREIGKSIQGNHDLSGISSKDQIGGLKEALIQSAQTAVKSLGKKDGYLGNPKVRIPLPEKLQRLDDLLSRVGMGKYGDDLRTSMNRAAEAAAPEAKDLLIGAVRNMSIEDATGILTGGSDAATQYFRSKTEGQIAARFRPIVEKAMKKVKLAEKYDEFAGKGARLGLIDSKSASLEDYVTGKAIDGLFLVMAEEEQAIRSDPLKATGALARKVFSAVR